MLQLQAQGVRPPYCSNCRYQAMVGAELLCNRFGAYVRIHSRCELFESTPEMHDRVILPKELSTRELEVLWPEGVLNLRR